MIDDIGDDDNDDDGDNDDDNDDNDDDEFYHYRYQKYFYNSCWVKMNKPPGAERMENSAYW